MTDRGQLSGSESEPANRAGAASRAFFWTVATIVVAVSVVTILGALATSGDEGGADRQQVVAAAVTAPFREPAAAEAPAVATGAETAAASTAAATPPPIASSIFATPTVGEAASATPVAAAPAVPDLSSEAVALAKAIEVLYSVRILTTGQDWGADGDAQLRNIEAVGKALEDVPAGVRTATASRGPLTFLSNRGGMTEAGWSPYGPREANFYTNEDVTASGRVPANQIVLQPGSTVQTIAHEIMHAFQMRDVAPGEYGAALLSPEMKSFMQTTGWTQIGTDDVVRAAISGGWDEVSALFEYDGRVLIYTNQFGDSMTLYAPNPLEAYAEAGGLLYGHSEGLTLPEWPEYWDWFQANLG